MKTQPESLHLADEKQVEWIIGCNMRVVEDNKC